MVERFHGGQVWNEVTGVVTGRGRRFAAVAFVGADAAKLLPLRRGDVLVVNASDRALLARATNPEAIRAYLDRGVRVLSSPNLHAKVIVTPTVAVIGSANASHTSAGLDEAVIISSDTRTVQAARRFVESLEHTTEVDEDFLEAARVTWARGRSGGPPGAGDNAADVGFLPEGPVRLWLEADAEWYYPSASEREVFQANARRSRRAAGPAAAYAIESYRTPRGDASIRRNDVVLQVCESRDGRALWPPGVVISDPLRIPRSGSVLYLLRTRKDLDEIPVSDVADRLRRAGIREPRLGQSRLIRSDPLKEALLGLWALD